MTAQILPFGSAYCLLKVNLEADNNFQKITSMPGFKAWQGREMRFRPTTNNIRYIGENWPDAEWHPETQIHLENFIKEQNAAAEASLNKRILLEDDGSYLYKTKPFDHQRHLFLLSREKPVFAYFMEQGTGKTKPAIDTAAWQYSQGLIDALIVIAPNGVHTNWVEEEIPIHLPDWCQRKVWVYSSNMTKKKLKELEEVLAAENCLKIFSFNIEGFTSDKAKKILERILRSLRCNITIDESQGIKNHSAMRTKYLTTTCLDTPYKRILTGTSVTKGIEDLYGQFSWLWKGILGFDSFYTFRNYFCTMGGYEMKQIKGYKNMDVLTNLIDPYSYRVTKKECLDLPDKLYKRWVVEMTPQQKAIYNKMTKDYYAEIVGHGTISAPLAIVRMLRLQQISCGWFPNEEMIRIPGDNPKLEAVRSHCATTEGPILVWSRFSKDIELMVDELGRDHGKDNVARYDGSTSAEDRPKIVKAFQAGEIKALICSKAAARGLTLTACENPIYHSQDFDLEARLQSEDRCHRIGTKNSVTYTDVVAKGTIDTKIINALRKKKSIADIINQDGETLFLESED